MLHPFQFYRIGFLRIPLANVYVLVVVYTNVMAVHENWFFLNHELQLSIAVFGLSSARIGNNFIIFVKNRHETGIIRLVQISQSRPAYT